MTITMQNGSWKQLRRRAVVGRRDYKKGTVKMERQREVNPGLEVEVYRFRFDDKKLIFTYEVLIRKNGRDLPLIPGDVKLKPLRSVVRIKAFRERLTREILKPLHDHPDISQPEYAEVKERLNAELQENYEDVLTDAFNTAKAKGMSL